MSTDNYADLSQLFKKLQESKNPLIKPIEAIEINSIINPVVFKNGVTVITHNERIKAANLATFISTKLIQDNKYKVLHVTLEEFVQSLYEDYVSNFSGEKIRNLKNTNYSVDHLEDNLKDMYELLKISPVKDDTNIVVELLNNVYKTIDEGDFNLIIFEGIDKSFSKNNRQKQINELLLTLLNKAQTKEISIICAFKEEEFPLIPKVNYLKLTGNDRINLEINGKEEKLIKLEDYCLFIPEFDIYQRSNEADQVCVGYDMLEKKFLYQSFSIHKQLILPYQLKEDQKSIKLFIDLNHSYKDGIKIIGNVNLKELEKYVIPLTDQSTYIDQLYLEYLERSQVLEKTTLELYEDQNNIKLKKHILFFNTQNDNFFFDWGKVEIMINDSHKYGIIIKMIMPNELPFDVSKDLEFTKKIGTMTEYVESDNGNVVSLNSKIPKKLINIVSKYLSYDDKKERNDLYYKNVLKHFDSINTISKDEILKIVNSGYLDNKMCYGFKEKYKELLIVDYEFYPGVLFVGGMGTGKSMSMRTTMLLHYLANAHKTQYYLVDILKGMNDYSAFFGKENVHTVFSSEKFCELLEFLLVEITTRKILFETEGVSSINKYNKISSEPINEIVICVEEMGALMNFQEIKYHLNVDSENSYANALKNIMRIGRSYGIIFLISSQRATSDDIPSSLKPGITHILGFRINNPGDIFGLNLNHIREIKIEERGRCAYQDGFIKYPLVSDELILELLNEYDKAHIGINVT